VANATIASLLAPTAGGRRIVLVAGIITPQLIVNIIKRRFPRLSDRLPSGGNAEQIYPAGVNPTGWGVGKSEAILSEWDGLKGGKWEYLSLEKSVVDTVTKLLQLEDEWAKLGFKR
jgi:hypothetical protein